MKWTPREVLISDLKQHPNNPRKISKNDLAQLKTSLDKFGLCEYVVCNTDGTVIGGHQRLKALKSMKQKTVTALFPEEELTSKDVDELNIRLNRNSGEWDFDILKEWDTNSLLQWGFEASEFPGVEDVVSKKGDKIKDKKKCPSCGYVL